MLTTDSSAPIAGPAASHAPARSLAATTLLALMLLAAGCATRPEAAPPAPPPPPPVAAPACDPPLEAADRANRHVVAQQDRLSGMTPGEIGSEASRPFDANTPPPALVDIALALALTRVPGDLAKAQSLLDQVARNPTPVAEPWKGVVHVLAVRLAEQRRSEEVSERTAQLLRDNQRDSQKKLDQLNEKLEALKAIERSLNTRPGASAPKTGP
jgi:hypothetical protein